MRKLTAEWTGSNDNNYHPTKEYGTYQGNKVYYLVYYGGKWGFCDVTQSMSSVFDPACVCDTWEESVIHALSFPFFTNGIYEFDNLSEFADWGVDRKKECL